MLTRALWVAAILGLAAATTLEVKGFGFETSPPALANQQELNTATSTTVTSVCRTKAGCWIEFQGTNTRVQTITSTGTTGIPAVNNAASPIVVINAKALVTFDQTLNFVDGVKTVNYLLAYAARACTANVDGIPLLELGEPMEEPLWDLIDENNHNNPADADLCKAYCNSFDQCTYWVQSVTAGPEFKSRCSVYRPAFPAATNPNGPMIDGDIKSYGSCSYTNKADTYKLALQFEDIWDTASTYQATMLNVMSASSTNTNAQRIAVPLVSYTPDPTYSFQCTGLVECSMFQNFGVVANPLVATPFAPSDNVQTDLVTGRRFGYVWVRAKTGKVGASHKFDVAAQPAITITSSGSGTAYTIPLSLSGLFAGLTSANFAPGVISANGEVGKAVSTATPNTTLEVNSIRSQRVLLDDEFRTVASGIVYAAVGSAFAFVLCLGAVAAAIGSKAAAKGVTQ